MTHKILLTAESSAEGLPALIEEQVREPLYNEETVTMIIWTIFIGVSIALIMSAFCRYFSSRIVRVLTEKGAVTPEGALTVDEMGLPLGFVSYLMLREYSGLRKYVFTRELGKGVFAPILGGDSESACGEPNGGDEAGKAGENKGEGKADKVKLSSLHFYLPEERRIAAETRYGNEKKPLLGLILSVIVLAAAITVALWLIPWMVEFAANFGISLIPENNIY